MLTCASRALETLTEKCGSFPPYARCHRKGLRREEDARCRGKGLPREAKATYRSDLASGKLQMAPDGSGRLQMAPDGFSNSRRLQMAPDGSRWLQKAPDIQTAPDGPSSYTQPLCPLLCYAELST
jgi:hypothetical protein